ncbi:MAG: LCP family protein [Coriobacteriia bacterium]|nr:LCP family protein [Coriobacteriia bacterium]
MGKHSQRRTLGSGGERPRRERPDARRVPAERRRTPGESSTADGMHADAETYRLSDPKSRRRGSLESAPARLRVERDRRRSRAKKIAVGVFAGALVLLLLGAVGVFAYAKHLERTMQTTVVNKQQLDTVLTEAKPMEPFNLLILGADYRKGDTAYRTDSMIVAHVDPKEQKVWLLSIPRDTRVEIPGYGGQKINAAHAYGGPEGAIKATERLTGLKINHYLEANFQGFTKAVDALGGVWVNVPVAINDTEADATKGDKASHIDKGYQLLDGPHALTFVRARHQFADQDFARMRNQQLFFKALADQVAKIDNIAKLPSVVSAVAPYISTDMTLVDMIRLAQALKGAGSKNLYATTVKGTWRSPFVWTDEAYLKKAITAIKNGEPFVKPKVKKAATVAKKPADVTVTVRNGSGISGVANQAASILKAKDFKIKDVGNAGQNVYKKTLIIYKTDKAAATLVSQYLPPGTTIVQSRGMYSYTGQILVVVGKDWDVSKVPAATVITQ